MPHKRKVLSTAHSSWAPAKQNNGTLNNTQAPSCLRKAWTRGGGTLAPSLCAHALPRTSVLPGGWTGACPLTEPYRPGVEQTPKEAICSSKKERKGRRRSDGSDRHWLANKECQQGVVLKDAQTAPTQGPHGTHVHSLGVPGTSLGACSELGCWKQEEGLCCSEIVTLNQRARLTGRRRAADPLLGSLQLPQARQEDNVTQEKGPRSLRSEISRRVSR